MEDFAAMNAVYSEFFNENKPARATVQAARLPKDARVEIECIRAGLKILKPNAKRYYAFGN